MNETFEIDSLSMGHIKEIQSLLVDIYAIKEQNNDLLIFSDRFFLRQEPAYFIRYALNGVVLELGEILDRMRENVDE